VFGVRACVNAGILHLPGNQRSQDQDMLQKIREHATGWVAVLILGLIALSFVFFGIDFGTPGANVALRVNGEEIQRFEFDNVVRQNINRIQQSQSEPLTPELEQLVRAQSIDALVNRELVDQVAQQRGFRVSAASLSEEIRSIPNFQIDGQFDQQVYFDALESVGRNPTSFENDMRQDLQRRQVQATFEQTAFVTPVELRERIALVNQSRTIDYLQIPVGIAMGEVEVTEDDILARYESFPEAYTDPEQVTLQYLELRLEDVAGEIEVSEDELREAYESGVATERYSTPEERKIRHILVRSTDELSPPDARARAQSLLDQINDGADFAALASEQSDDTLSGPQGGDLGWVLPGTLDEALIDAAFATEPGQVTGPVQTSFGFHLVKVDDIRGGDVTSFDDVRADLVAELQQNRADSLFIDRGEELAELTFQNSTSLEPAASALGIVVGTLSGVTADSGTGVASDAKVREAAFEYEVLEEGLNSGVIELEFGHLVVVRVTERTPARLRPLDDVRDSITSVVRVEKAREQVRERGKALQDQLADGATLAALAAEVGEGLAPVEDYELTRQSREVPTQLVNAVFAAPTPGEDGDPVTGGVSLLIGDYVVYQLKSVDSGELSEEIAEQVEAQLVREHAAMEFNAWLNALKDDAKVFVAKGLRDVGEQP
jgi:peptidyl-prolyl cis-trans isomerase D